ncbi:hypothetical protein GCM10010452_00710 [Crossiella cryophila]
MFASLVQVYSVTGPLHGSKGPAVELAIAAGAIAVMVAKATTAAFAASAALLM